jgi:hypothetical protein
MLIDENDDRKRTVHLNVIKKPQKYAEMKCGSQSRGAKRGLNQCK